MNHPDPALLEALVLGSLDLDASGELLAHLATCDACAQQLEREARLECALLEVRAEQARRQGAAGLTATVRPVGRWRRWVGGAVALAAAAVLALGLRRGLSPRVAPVATVVIAPVVCPEGVDQARCLQEAHRHGLYVSLPSGAGVPPFGGGRAPGAGPTTPLFPLAER